MQQIKLDLIKTAAARPAAVEKRPGPDGPGPGDWVHWESSGPDSSFILSQLLFDPFQLFPSGRTTESQNLD